jgi:hypothetical protein
VAGLAILGVTGPGISRCRETGHRLAVGRLPSKIPSGFYEVEVGVP